MPVAAIPGVLLALCRAGRWPRINLPSRDLDLPIAIVPDVEPRRASIWKDFREEQRAPAKSRGGHRPAQHFLVSSTWAWLAGGTAHRPRERRFYLTVAEWGRWNFGVPSMEIRHGRYPVYTR